MKKILSILLTVTMIFSLVAAFRAPTASAFPTTNAITLTTSNYVSKYLTSKLSGAKDDPKVDPYWIFNYFSRWDANLPVNKLNNADAVPPSMTYEVYKMGDVIYGYVTGFNPTGPWSAILAKYRPDLGTNMYKAIDIQNQVAGINKFSLSTGNVDVDGEYLVVIRNGYTFPSFNDEFNVLTDSSVVDKEVVYITYNMTIVS